jgi:hypothetical protein
MKHVNKLSVSDKQSKPDVKLTAKCPTHSCKCQPQAQSKIRRHVIVDQEDPNSADLSAYTKLPPGGIRKKVNGYGTLKVSFPNSKKLKSIKSEINIISKNFVTIFVCVG